MSKKQKIFTVVDTTILSTKRPYKDLDSQKQIRDNQQLDSLNNSRSQQQQSQQQGFVSSKHIKPNPKVENNSSQQNLKKIIGNTIFSTTSDLEQQQQLQQQQTFSLNLETLNSINNGSSNQQFLVKQPSFTVSSNNNNFGNISNNHLNIPNNINNEENKDQEKKVIQLQKDYEKQSMVYNNDGYTYQSNQILKKISFQPNASKVSCKYPLFKMLRAVAKKFLFNELEIIFFAYILDENDWKYSDENIQKFSANLTDFLSITEVSDMREYKCLLLYLVLNAYAVKYYLNQFQEMEMFDAHVSSIVQEFQQLFSLWSKIYATRSLKINPKKLNMIFIKLSAKPQDGSKRNVEDYNGLVDNIIQISPPYNNNNNNNNNNAAAGNSNNNNANDKHISTSQLQHQSQQQIQVLGNGNNNSNNNSFEINNTSSFGNNNNNSSFINQNKFSGIPGLNGNLYGNSLISKYNNQGTNSSISFLQSMMPNEELFPISLSRHQSNNNDLNINMLEFTKQQSGISQYDQNDSIIDKEIDKQINNDKIQPFQNNFLFNQNANNNNNNNQNESTDNNNQNHLNEHPFVQLSNRLFIEPQSQQQSHQQQQQYNTLNNSARLFQLANQSQQYNSNNNNNQSIDISINPTFLQLLQSKQLDLKNNDSLQLQPNIILQNSCSNNLINKNSQQQNQEQNENPVNQDQPSLQTKFSNSIFINFADNNNNNQKGDF